AYDKGNRILLCGSFSKSLSPGFRIGWVVAGDKTLTIQRLQHLSTLSTSIPIQLGLSHYLTYYSYDNHLRKTRRTLAARKADHIACLEKHLPEGVKIHGRKGGYFLWVELDPSIDVEVLYEKGIEENLSIAPGIIFSSDKKFSHHIRINTSYECEENIRVGIESLGQIIQTLQEPKC
ncbi:GntR family transcriptional regulator, partial [Vibrio nigripulchritudo ATCC 27043]|uniref:aminotransferase class I/II-fold pyridoxal phosphate-dependent enzyme n=1 Tax=Vibrio nigripulchritudo TaxID=28173 RepID=UPI00021C2A63